MSKSLPGTGYQKEKTNIFELEPLKTEVSVIGYLFRIVLTGFLAAFALFFLVITLSMLLSPVIYERPLMTQKQTEAKVLGATTSNNSLVGNILKTVLKPLGYVSLWLVKLPGEGKTVIDPLTTTSINDIFEYDNTRNKVIVKKELIFADKSAVGSSVTQWKDIQDVPPLLSTLNGIAGDENTNINLVEGNNIEITLDKAKNSLTISSTGSGVVTGNSQVNLTAGSGISVSGTSPDFSISNTDRGGSQKIFKNVKVTGQSTLVSDSNNDSLTFAAGAGIALTTSAGSDTITIASTGGAVSFDAVTAGTNTEALLIGTGGSLGVTGAGTITATNLTAGSSVVSDAEVDDNITVDWSGLQSHPAACGAGTAVTALDDIPTCTAFWGSGNDGSGSTLDADLIDGIDSTSLVQTTRTLTAGAGLSGGGDLSANRSFDVNTGNGIQIATDSVALGALSAEWDQTGGFDIFLDHASSELKIIGSGVAETFYGLFDVGDLSGNETYTFTTGGTVWTSGNDGAASTLDADLLDGLSSGSLLRSDTSDNFTSGTLTFDAGTTLAISGNLSLPSSGITGAGSGSGLDADLFDGSDSSAFSPVAGSASITTVGALASGSIAAGFGAIDVGADNITGATLNGTTGINTGAGAGTNRIDASGNLVNIGSISSSGDYTYSFTSTTTTGNVFTLSDTQLRTSGSVLSASGVGSPADNTISIFKFVPYAINAGADAGDLINGISVEWQQGNVFDTQAAAENILNLTVITQGASKTDATISTGLLINNADTSTGNQIVITDGLKFSSAAGDTAAFTNYINSTNFVVTSAGAISAASTIAGSELRSNSNIYLNYDGADATSILYFYESSDPTGEYLRWLDSSAYFNLSDDLDIDNHAAIGTSASPSSTYALTISEDTTYDAAFRGGINVTTIGRTDNAMYGIYSLFEPFALTTNITAIQRGIYSDTVALGSSAGGPSAFTISDIRNFDSYVRSTTFPPLVTDFYNYRVSNPNITDPDGEITNFYGFYIEDITEGDITNKYGFYQAGTNATNYFGGETRFDSDVAFGAQATLAVNDTTPDVSASSSFITANTAGTLISDFDAGAGTLQAGHVIFVEVNDANTDFDCTASGLNCGSTDITTIAAGDFFTWYYDGTDWHLVSFMDDSDNHNAGSGFDLAELFPSAATLEPGDLVSIDTNSPTGYVQRSAEPNDNKLIGIVSTSPGLTLGAPADVTAYPVALAGRVPTKVSTENGNIEPGDPLTSSSTPGVAMKAAESGPIIGKALESYNGAEVGKVMVFVSTGWYVAPLGQDVSSKMSDLSGLTSIDTQRLTAGVINTQVLFVGGKKLSVNSDGWLVADSDMEIKGDLKVAGEITTKKLNVSDEAAGTTTLKAGQTKIFVPTSLLTEKSQVLVTPNTLISAGIAVTKKEPGKGFTVEIANPENKDIELDWFIVN